MESDPKVIVSLSRGEQERPAVPKPEAEPVFVPRPGEVPARPQRETPRPQPASPRTLPVEEPEKVE